MFKIHKIFLHIPLFLLIFCTIAPSAYSFDAEVEERPAISFQFRPKTAPVADARELFVGTFDKTYAHLEPQQLNAQFSSRADVTRWLEATFDEEWEDFQTAEHDMWFIDLVQSFEGASRLIGFAIVEQWGEEKDTLYIRQMAILPEKQGQGYALRDTFNFLKSLDDCRFNKILADTRKINEKVIALARQVEARELDLAHNPELRSDYYLGFEWTRPGSGSASSASASASSSSSSGGST